MICVTINASNLFEYFGRKWVMLPGFYVTTMFVKKMKLKHFHLVI